MALRRLIGEIPYQPAEWCQFAIFQPEGTAGNQTEEMTMRIRLAVIGLLMSWTFAGCAAGGPARPNSGARPVDPTVHAVLQEAGELALKQDARQNYWSDRVLLYIGNEQSRAGDFDAALRTIRASNDAYGRDAGLVSFAEALAADGMYERALDSLRLLRSENAWRQGYLEDRVRLRWIDYLIAHGEFGRAGKAVEQLKSEENRPAGLRKLAVAYARSGDSARAEEQFARAADSTANLKDEMDRARALLEVADAELTVGRVDAAKSTIRQLAGAVEFKDPWARVATLWETAALAARANDEQAARRLFHGAVEAQKSVNAINQTNALEQIATAQAKAGYIDDALNTAWMIKHDKDEFARDADREAALCAIAVAQFNANDPEGAVRTALSVKYFVQYRDEALDNFVTCQIAERKLKAALATAQLIGNPSTKATAILKVATAHADSGDRETAAAVASRIELTEGSFPRPTPTEKEHFDYRVPRSWGVRYEDGLAGTMLSIQIASRDAAKVAAAAMSLSQALGQRPDRSYAISFDEICTEEVTQALARAHAAKGDPAEAVAWARRIGSSGKVNSDENCWAVQRRIYALIGAAEGILDRTGE
jgi:tetratricopeptide (TPR) repeat protein